MNNQKSLGRFIMEIPKAELHLHIEGTLEPDLMLALAKRNNISLPYSSAAELKKAYNFNNLQDFLDLYYQGAGVLQAEQDFYDLTLAYLQKARSQGVLYAEIFFDPQTHTARGIPFQTVIDGITKALTDGRDKFGISSKLILCFLRHLEEWQAIETLEQALPYKEKIIAVGLDSSEKNNPPSKFQHVFERARQAGFLVTAHAGEEGPASYVWATLNILQAVRIDHGNHALDDEMLIRELVEKQIPLTVCPLSNLKLKVISDMEKHPLKKMLSKGLLVSINSDDPAYFGGYIGANYQAVAEALDLSKKEIIQLAKNSFKSSFLSTSDKQAMIKKIEDYENIENLAYPVK